MRALVGGACPATDAPQRCSQGGIAIVVYQRGGLHCVLPVGSRPTPVGMRTLRASAAFIAVLLAAGGAACVDAKSSSSRRRASRSSWHPFEEPPQDAVSLGRLRHHSGRMIDQQDKVGCCNNATVAFALFQGCLGCHCSGRWLQGSTTYVVTGSRSESPHWHPLALPPRVTPHHDSTHHDEVRQDVVT